MRGFRLLRRAFPGFFCLLVSGGTLSAAGGISTAIPTIQATRTVSLCAVTGGPRQQALAKTLEEFRQAALAWSVEITLLPYRDTAQATADFSNGVCDLVNLPGAEMEDYNRFSATLEAPGALPDDDHLRTTLRALALEKATPLLRNGEYEVVSIWPAGARYVWVANRDMQTPATLAGRTVSAHAEPQALSILAEMTGMTVVNGNRGLAPDLWTGNADEERPSGYVGVLSLPMNMQTHQLLARHSALPADFGHKARQFAEQQFDQLRTRFNTGYQRWPAERWINLDTQQRNDWQSLYQQIRVRLRNDGIYDPGALTLLRKVRCALDSSRLECGGGAVQVE